MNRGVDGRKILSRMLSASASALATATATATVIGGLALALFGACGDHPELDGKRPDPSPTLGARCERDTDCVVRCVRGDEFPDGFCTMPCAGQEGCPKGTVCINDMDGICLYPCNEDADCTLAGPRYYCRELSDALGDTFRVCIGL